ncbi:MAG: hypothetical protein A3E07_00980 [Candidatus Wildermuthbacteria bacterium RIFCSPHIGHO2_12_FULL_45_9]|uniref:SHS2 domain-containing protein n=1 Tax=Candidatus Wildermuthbacteria bacterium RIFCSPHIGHO2_02_FULL_45_25 TaxID=1802450 RepID=A0A1G2R1N7_9BACT|nr:MAG: hypothetical protein A2748_03360 [Candidatus Wildermuthbacteria bacterium RIFCSPHIGHO2_01_FULL_45_20]OHA66617.1 MAG: hypothetical protein A3C04_00475 [Candidatus Wildermuthbacteria bacterium RIFCSPHIGHO2_02_FULL_45_25]OHA71514.1 MAG: hypothetical protein A3E07_00980 [Candidatus Wildermuthbacteria bacterium RIFCSPHIGHO2_12_FULL_45_9]
MGLFSRTIVPKSFIGVDIGTSALRVVELSGWGDRKTLKNYAQLRVESLYDKPFRAYEQNSLALSSQDLARALRALFEDAGMKNRKAIFSISDFSSFFTSFELPATITRKELESAVQFEARKHIPLSLSEVTMDWQILDGPDKGKGTNPYRVLMVAVPNEIVNEYQNIAKIAGIELIAIEAEVFGVIRACLPEEHGLTLLIEMGAQTTTISVVENRKLYLSRSMDQGGNALTRRISEALAIDYLAAEKEKIAKGLDVKVGETKILLPIVDLIVTEVDKFRQVAERQEKKTIGKIVIAGGSARLPGLAAYMQSKIGVPAEVANPFREIVYPPVLEPVVQDMGPAFSVAIGIALRGFVS